MHVISPLLTDLYQLTMAYGYWKLNMHHREAVFHLSFRHAPFKNNYALAAGLADVIGFLQNWHFAEDDLAYLNGLCSPNGAPLFDAEFLDYLRNMQFSCDIDAILEGTLVFPHEPLLRVKGPLLQGQLLESTLLNIINFQTLIATKAARVCRAAQGEPVLEFGLRRAQGSDGALSASRAAYIGGCAATSNVLAGKLYDIPVRGTHAHSWVTAFADEKSAFAAYASVMPHNCVLLVDTYDTIAGIKHAIEIGEILREEGAEFAGIRLDSGDLAELSKQARVLLDNAGFTDTNIIASNNLDEYAIADLKQQGAKISVWGVGTHLVTAYDQPALDGVYKLSALRDEEGQWQYKLKLSEQAIKISNPGLHQVRRFFQNTRMVMDSVFDLELGAPDSIYENFIDLLQPIFRDGKLIYQLPSIHAIREYAKQEVMRAQSIVNYPVKLEKKLQELKHKIIKKFPLRRIRSFVRRDGRMTDAQREALQMGLPKFGLQLADGIIDLIKIFERDAPRILEIGFGSGYSLLEMAKSHPDKDFIGIETYQPGVGNLLLNMQQQRVNNIRIYYADAVEVLENCILPQSLDVIQIFFPDPWPKRRHHKRRLIQPEFVHLLAAKLKTAGTLHLATDWKEYAEDMMQVLSASPEFTNLAGSFQFATRSSQRPVITKFEQRGESSGREIFELQFVKRDSPLDI